MLLLRLPGVFLLRLDKASLSSLLLKDAPRTERGPDTPVWKIGRAPQPACRLRLKQFNEAVAAAGKPPAPPVNGAAAPRPAG